MLTEFKILLLQKRITMADFCLKAGYSREYVYRKLKQKDENFFKKIKLFYITL